VATYPRRRLRVHRVSISKEGAATSLYGKSIVRYPASTSARSFGQYGPTVSE